MQNNVDFMVFFLIEGVGGGGIGYGWNDGFYIGIMIFVSEIDVFRQFIFDFVYVWCMFSMVIIGY